MFLQIDCATVQIMEEDTLRKWIPHYGDRLMLKNFCRRKIMPRKYSLIERLRNKIAAKNANTTNNNQNEGKRDRMNKSVRKETRMIEIGWFCFNEKDKKLYQVKNIKTSDGGGTRKISVPRNSTGHDILKRAIELFFPNGVSSKGPASAFDITLRDFQRNLLNMDLTVQEMYNITALSKLRMYLACESNNNYEHEEVNLPSTSTSTARHRSTRNSNGGKIHAISEDLTSFLSNYDPQVSKNKHNGKHKLTC